MEKTADTGLRVSRIGDISEVHYTLDGATMSPSSHSESSITLSVEWSGPHTIDTVRKEFNDGGTAPEYNGRDYGLYQIYGNHILNGPDTLLYIGKATQQTFSARFYDHREWLIQEDEISIYLGRIYDRERHAAGPANDWPIWAKDVLIAESVLIYKYSPNYNSVAVAEPPSLKPYARVLLQHSGHRHRLHANDVAPDDWR